jgi:hypothetical protein
MRLLYLFPLLLITACTPLVPATTPPQLEFTPGAFITVDDEVVDAGFFHVNYPDGWRIVKTSIAAAPLEIVFASPDNSMTIHIVEGEYPSIESTRDPNIYERRTSRRLSDTTLLTIFGQASIEAQDEFNTLFDTVLNSIVLETEN